MLWEIREISDSSYQLQITSDSVPGVAWTVTPEGVRARQVEDNRIYLATRSFVRYESSLGQSAIRLIHVSS